MSHANDKAGPYALSMGAERQPDPEPLETDDVRVVLVGTAAWAVALVALAVARLAGAPVHGWWLVMCAYGGGLGLLGVRYTQSRRAAIARNGASTDRGPRTQRADDIVS